jgi:hypothetical protein
MKRITLALVLFLGVAGPAAAMVAGGRTHGSIFNNRKGTPVHLAVGAVRAAPTHAFASPDVTALRA